MSPELVDLLGWENLLQRARISELGHLAAGYAKPAPRGHLRIKGNPHSAYTFARMAVHDARLLFPEQLGDPEFWQGTRYGQQLTLPQEAA